MKILLFDDDKSTVDMLLNTIDWEKLGFDEFAPVYSMAQAQVDFIENGPADVMICDIEAPGGTGLDLLRWVREKGYQTENVFLTNYDSFAFASEAMKLDCVEYILKMSPVSDVVKAVVRALDRIAIRNRLLAYEDGMVARGLETEPLPAAELPELPAERWQGLLDKKEKGRLFSEIQRHLNEMSKAGLADRTGLLHFSHAYLRMLVNVAEKHGIAANAVFSEAPALHLFSAALDSIFHMLQWVDYSLSTMVRDMETTGSESTVMDQVKSYIDIHFTEKISRSDLAAKFFLSQDYLSHAFNAKFGVTIPEYINRLRISLARENLDRGRNVTEAAGLAGFDNLSYFSTLFKKMTGVSPSDYSRGMRKNGE